MDNLPIEPKLELDAGGFPIVECIDVFELPWSAEPYGGSRYRLHFAAGQDLVVGIVELNLFPRMRKTILHRFNVKLPTGKKANLWLTAVWRLACEATNRIKYAKRVENATS